MTLTHSHKAAILIFFLALSMRLFFVFPILTTPNFTGATIALDGYYEIANNLMAGNGFSRSVEPPIAPDSVRMPLYPILIVGILSIFGSYKALVVFHVLVGSLSPILAWLIAKEFLGDSLGAFLVGVVMAVEPLMASITGLILTETFFTVLLLMMTLAFLKYLKEKRMTHLLAFSILLGACTLVRPTTQYFPLFMIALMWLEGHFRITKKFITHALIVVGIFLIMVFPWSYRNNHVFHTWSLNVQPVSILYAFLVPSTIALENHQTYDQAKDAFLAREHVGSIEDVNLGNAAEFKKRAMAELAQHPKGLAESIVITMYGFFTHDGYAGILNGFGSKTVVSYAHPPLSQLITNPGAFFSFLWSLAQGPGLLVLVGRIFWILISLFTFCGGILYLVEKKFEPKFLFIAGSIAYFALTSIVVGLAINARFRIPVNAFILILAWYALEFFFIKIKNLKVRTT